MSSYEAHKDLSSQIDEYKVKINRIDQKIRLEASQLNMIKNEQENGLNSHSFALSIAMLILNE